MQSPSLPGNESNRLCKLEELELLKAISEPELDDLTYLAANICGAPIALISIVDEHRQWFKSKIGLGACETSREISFCGHAILNSDLFIVPDTLKDDRFADNPLVVGEPNIRFYAGAPLITSDGFAIGTLCVIDQKPRELDASKKKALQILSRQVVAQIELRHQSREVVNNENLLRTIFDSEPDCVKIIDREGCVTTMNRAGLRMIGVESLDDVVGKNIFPMIEPEYRPSYEALIQKAFRGESGELKFSMITDGRKRWLETHSAPFRNERNEVVGQLSITRDITEKQEAERELQKSELQLRLAIEAAQIGTFDWDVVQNRISWSHRHEELWGYKTGEFDGSFEAFSNRLHPDDAPEITREINRCIEAHETFSKEFRIIRPSGRICWIFSRGEFSFDEDNRAVRMRGVVIDVSERKTAEKTLEHQAAILQETGRIAHVGGWEFDVATNTGTWTDEVARIHDVDPKRSVDKTFGMSFYSGEHLKRINQALEQAVNAGTPYDLELELTSAKGIKKWVRTIGKPVIQNGKVTGVRGSFQDISKLKRADQALRKSEQYLRNLIDGLGPSVFVTLLSPDGTILVTNKSTLRISNSTLDKISGKKIQDLPHWNHSADVNQQLRAAIRNASNGEPSRFDSQLLTSDHQLIDIDFSLEPARDSEGNVELIVASANDITQRKRAEEVMAQSQMHLTSLINSVDGIVWEADIETLRFTYVSPRAERLLGYPVTRWTEESSFWIDHIHPADRETAVNFCMNSSKAMQDHEFEYRMVTQDGKIVWLRDIVTVVVEDGLPVALRGIMVDITSKKESEESIRRLNRTFAVLSDINQLIVREKDTHSLLVSACRIAVDVGEFEMAWIGMSDEASSRLDVTAHAGADEQTITLLESLMGDEHRRPACSFTVTAMEDGKPSFTNNVATDPLTEAWRDVALERNYHAVIALPLKAGGKTIGTFNLYSPESGIFDKKEVQLLEELSADISFALEFHRQREERRQIDQALIQVERRFRVLIEHSADSITLIDANRKIVYASPSVTSIEGFSPEEIVGKDAFDGTHPDDLPKIRRLISQLLKKPGEPVPILWRRRHKEGRWLWLEGIATNLLNDPAVEAIVTNYRDVTDRIQLEEEFRQSQKLEAFGQLAGGVAHDFNNILTVINGYGTMLMAGEQGDQEIEDAANQIVEASERAASLTRQLLTFSRRQVMQPKRLNLNENVTNLVKMLHRILGEDITLQLALHSRPLMTRADSGMLDQVLLNLVVNARDAMSGGGQLSIETGEIILSEKNANAFPGLAPGRFVRLCVSDNGDGIPQEHLSRIFEPFFTTKEQGKGTGLGLATVFGIVKQHDGSVTVESVEGEGTKFQILLPEADGQESFSDKVEEKLRPRGGSETILLVEDENPVRLLGRHVLERAGYEVLEASNGVEALEVWERNKDRISLLYTDMVMPEGISGHDLATRLQEQNPKLKVVFTSGYSSDFAGKELDLKEGQNFIQKPSQLGQVLRTVRQSLDLLSS